MSKFLVNEPNQSDGLEFAKQLESGSVACAFFDPQYRDDIVANVDQDKAGARFKARAGLSGMSMEYIAEVVRELERALRPSGHLFLWTDKYTVMKMEWPMWIEGSKLELVDMLFWGKSQMGMGVRTRRIAEPLIIFQKEPLRAKDVWTRHDIRDVVIEHTVRTATHSKPIDLQQDLIEAVTDPGDLVVDPAAGTYSVMNAAMNCGRNFLGCDILGVRSVTRKMEM